MRLHLRRQRQQRPLTRRCNLLACLQRRGCSLCLLNAESFGCAMATDITTAVIRLPSQGQLLRFFDTGIQQFSDPGAMLATPPLHSLMLQHF